MLEGGTVGREAGQPDLDREQAGAELCQAQGKLRLVMLSVKNVNKRFF